MSGAVAGAAAAAASDIHTFPAPAAVNSYAESTSAVTARLETRAAGDVYAANVTPTPTVDVGDWLAPKTNMSDYEGFLHKESGTTTPAGDAMDTWVNLGTNRSWTITNAVAGTSKNASCTFQIRRAATGVVVFTSTTGGWSIDATRL